MTRAKYTEKHPEMLREFVKKGLHDFEICKELGITKQTFYRWLKIHEEFRDAYTEETEDSGVLLLVILTIILGIVTFHYLLMV